MRKAIFVVMTILVGLFVSVNLVSANRSEVTATCEGGLIFEMERGEVGSIIDVFIDGRRVFPEPFVIAAQNDPLFFTHPNPDKSRPHTWVITVDSLYNEDQRLVRSVGTCITPTTTVSTTAVSTTTVATTPSTTTTTPKSPDTTTTSVPVANSTPTTVKPATPNVTPPQTLLPATGRNHIWNWFLMGAGVILILGVLITLFSRDPRTVRREK